MAKKAKDRNVAGRPDNSLLEETDNFLLYKSTNPNINKTNIGRATAG